MDRENVQQVDTWCNQESLHANKDSKKSSNIEADSLHSDVKTNWRNKVSKQYYVPLPKSWSHKNRYHIHFITSSCWTCHKILISVKAAIVKGKYSHWQTKIWKKTLFRTNRKSKTQTCGNSKQTTVRVLRRKVFLSQPRVVTWINFREYKNRWSKRTNLLTTLFGKAVKAWPIRCRLVSSTTCNSK